ncbi:DUF5789 family protein [Halobellus rubicundus]|uniref:Uncharacterized protein n=1 Tax=Halobellus rubicundus TaxID=2996466 RepID=A0ABD5MC97_9EURY
MTESIRLNRIGTVFSGLSFPLSPSRAARECGDVTVWLADGSVTVDEVLRDSHTDRFASSEDLELEFLSLLPRSAVGEPFQSDGDA